MSMHSCALRISTHTDNSSNIVMVIKNKIFNITDTESVQAFILEWHDLMEEDTTWEIYQAVEMMTVVENRKQMIAKISMLLKKLAVLFLEKYLDFADVFSKTNADIFPEHSMHDFIIETKKEKIPLFSLMYNYLGVEL